MFEDWFSGTGGGGAGIGDFFSSLFSGATDAGGVVGGNAGGAIDYTSLAANTLGGATDTGGYTPAPISAGSSSFPNIAGLVGNSSPLDTTGTGVNSPGNVGAPGLNGLPGGGGGKGGAVDASGLWGKTEDFASKYGKFAIPAGAVGLAALKSGQGLPGVNTLKQDASTLRSAAPGLMAPLTTGAPLPGALGQDLMSSRDAQIAAIQSNFSRMGLSGSSMEQASINSARQQYATQTFQQAQSLYNTGLQTIGQADQLNSSIISLGLQQDQELTQALAAVAGGFAYGAAKNIFG